jgi:AcrR family transcriptional regulator
MRRKKPRRWEKCMSEVALRQRPGPKPRFTHDDLVDAALSVIDAEGFAALSLRAVARQLGITSMAIYTYVESREQLYRLVVDRLISAELDAFEWPDRWPDALRAFATNLSDLIDRHPALIDAFAAGQMHTPIAMTAADQMLQRLLDGGLPTRAAGVAYAAMHALVLGQAVLREAGRTTTTDGATPAGQAASPATPALTSFTASQGRLVDVRLPEMIDVLIAGIESRMPATAGQH